MEKSLLQSHILRKRAVKIDRSKETLVRVASYLGGLKYIHEKSAEVYDSLDEDRIVEKLSKLIKTPRDGIDGQTPTKDELLSLIRPLIPKPKDGKAADEKSIIEKILSKIPIPRDGKDAVIPDLRDLAINTINTIESLENEDRLDIKSIKGIRDYVWNILVELWAGEGGPGLIFHDSSLSGSGVPGDPLKVNGGIASNISFNETPSGSGTVFALSHTPNPANSLMLYRGGALQQASGSDYTLAGANITLNVALAVGETLLATYNY